MSDIQHCARRRISLRVDKSNKIINEDGHDHIMKSNENCSTGTCLLFTNTLLDTDLAISNTRACNESISYYTLGVIKNLLQLFNSLKFEILQTYSKSIEYGSLKQNKKIRKIFKQFIFNYNIKKSPASCSSTRGQNRKKTVWRSAFLLI